MNVPRASLRTLLPLALLLAAPSFAHAHVGTGLTHGFGHGAAHPLTGLDHVCAMVAVGLWASQRGGRALWQVPLAFVGCMALGGVLGMFAVPLPFVEQGILASVLVLGVLVAAAVRLPLAVSVGIVGSFALFHGFAHGTEMPAAASGVSYALGFIVSTALLHLGGIALGQGLPRGNPGSLLVRYAGGAVAACGVFLCFAA